MRIVARHPVAPYDFDCRYEHTCPYLDGLSTNWVYGEYRHLQEVYQEQLRIIDAFRETVDEQNTTIRALERELAEVRAKYQALHRKQFKQNKRPEETGDETAELDPKRSVRKKRKKRGAPIGHPAWTRPTPTEIDVTVQVPAPAVCPHCGAADLMPEGAFHEHIQEDIVLRPRPEVTKYVHEEAFCPHCRRSVVAAGPNEIPNAYIGPVAKGTANWLRFGIGISYRKVTAIFEELFGLSCVPASLVGFDNRAAGRGEPLYEDVREKIRVADVLYGDETSWRHDGEGHHAWFAGNDDLAFFHIDKSRSAKAAESVYGDFDGILVRDRYSGYNGIGRDWQACLAHIITNARELRKEHALLPIREQDRNISLFCDKVMDLCSRACETGNLLIAKKSPWSDAGTWERTFTKQLNTICRKPLSFKPAETLRSFLAGPDQKRLFTFLRAPGVSPTNNHAERSLRPLVIFRKTSFGTRSKSGIKTHSIMPSLVQTARRQNVNPREFLQTLHTADTATAQTALFNNTS